MKNGKAVAYSAKELNCPAMSQALKIDFVSDVACPWCVIGLYSLEQALQTLQDEVLVRLHIQPFELNPRMGPEGEDLFEHLMQKYGVTAAELAQSREMINRRGRECGFEFRPEGRGRVWNTFHLHRLLQWVSTESDSIQAVALNKQFMQAYHGRADNITDRKVVLACCDEAGLDMDRAIEVLDQGLYAQEVRERQAYFTQAGIRSVPAFIVNDKHLISGGQPAEVFVKALRQIAQVVAVDSGLMPL
jgi:predicted DsbA family dithiol-disulfide isomerase